MSTSKQDLFNDELSALLDKWYPGKYTLELNDYNYSDGFWIDISVEGNQNQQKNFRPFGLEFPQCPKFNIR